MRSSGPAGSLLVLEEIDDHLPQGSLWVQKGSEPSKTLKSALLAPPDVEEYISFCPSWDFTSDPNTSLLAVSTRCRFLPRADIPRAVTPS